MKSYNNFPEEIYSKLPSGEEMSDLILEYQSREDADDIIGEDEEKTIFQKEIEKIFEERCKKNEVAPSVGVNLKIQQSMDNMKISLEEMAKVAERRKAIANANDPSKTLYENLTDAYQATRPELSAEEVSETVSDIASFNH